MDARKIKVAVLGHSFVARSKSHIIRLLEGSEAVADYTILGSGGLKFGTEKYYTLLQKLTTFVTSSSLPVIVILFLGDNDMFSKGSDSFGGTTLKIAEVVRRMTEGWKSIKARARPAMIYPVMPALRRGRQNYNGTLPVIEFYTRAFARRRPWVSIISRNDGGGSCLDGVAPDGIHPLPSHYQSWILSYISEAISRYFTPPSTPGTAE